MLADVIPQRTRLVPAMARGFIGRCPHCGQGRIFGRFLKVRPDCEVCGLELHHHRADDLPPYAVIFIVGHIVGYLILETESAYDVPLWVEMGVWPVVTLAMALALLQPVKGAVVGLQYALGMQGFARLPRGGPAPGPEETHLAAAAAGVPDRDRA
ncbi:DUF983 domain-containing protein [Methylobacterium sp. J-030]|uniref:DUF983 domain-containing protein n=1 Tax=Methylobacterium sp. J-030 TaxID=2836627 RepID=UPI001FBBE9A5|nr:DUF983 domain-containing protein [Methylobacterium sp. J-030]MCJ2071174.1 DUF983 domain-containing protein [Methylobacterium sp. J-030]